MNEHKMKLIKSVKAVGQELINSAEKMVGDQKLRTSMRIEIDFDELSSVPLIRVINEYYSEEWHTTMIGSDTNE